MFQLLVSLVFGAVLWNWSKPIAGSLIQVPEASIYFGLIVLQVPFLVLMNFSQNLLKWSFERNKFLFVSLGSTIYSVTALVVGISHFNIGVAGILWISIINYVVFGCLGLWFVRRWLVIPKDFGFLKELLRYALPLGLICSAGAFVPIVERWLTNELLGL